jgi:predicted lipid-binding transport protein (Tim44 family)
MNEKVENLVLEHLRAIRGDMGRMADDVRGLRTEMTAMRQHMAGIVTIQEQDHSDIATLKVRVERIERRLELVDDRT